MFGGIIIVVFFFKKKAFKSVYSIRTLLSWNLILCVSVYLGWKQVVLVDENAVVIALY